MILFQNEFHKVVLQKKAFRRGNELNKSLISRKGPQVDSGSLKTASLNSYP